MPQPLVRRRRSFPDARRARVRSHLEESAAVQLLASRQCLDAIVQAADMVTSALAGGGRLLLCGNGGAAAGCQHMAAELVGLLDRDRDRPPLAAMALTTDTSFLTAFSNDHGFESVFERQVRALARRGDALFAVSTSGASPNVLRAVATAAQLDVGTIGVSGQLGVLKDGVDCAIVIPNADTRHVQESVLAVQHVICELVEQALFSSTGPPPGPPTR